MHCLGEMCVLIWLINTSHPLSLCRQQILQENYASIINSSSFMQMVIRRVKIVDHVLQGNNIHMCVEDTYILMQV